MLCSSLDSVRFEHSVCHGPFMATYVLIYIYIYIYIYNYINMYIYYIYIYIYHTDADRFGRVVVILDTEGRRKVAS